MAFTEITVVVDGAEMHHETYRSVYDAAALIQKTEQDAQTDGLHTQIYVVNHDHPDTYECVCVEYLTDHRPEYEWNTGAD